MNDDPIGDALHADAEAARAEIRTAGIVCPSCGKNTGDIFGRHRYEKPDGLIALGCDVIKCADGVPVLSADLTYEQLKAVANIDLADDAWQAESDYFDKHVIGTGPPNFTGLLEAL
jgi:hypothetical protein